MPHIGNWSMEGKPNEVEILKFTPKLGYNLKNLINHIFDKTLKAYYKSDG